MFLKFWIKDILKCLNINNEKKNNGLRIASVFIPSVKIVIISLSLNSFINVIEIPIIIINGRITENKFGIKKTDNFKIDKESICNKFDIDINLVNWSNQAIDKKINNISKNPLNISLNI